MITEPEVEQEKETLVDLQLNKEELESLKISLDMSVIRWRREAASEKDEHHRANFLELERKYVTLRDKVKTYLK